MAVVHQKRSYSSGSRAVVPGHGLMEAKATPVTKLGSIIDFDDGRAFRMSHYVADTTAAWLVSPDESAYSVAEVDQELTTDYVAGSRSVEMDLAAGAKDLYKDAFFCITDDSGEGYMYKIKGNTASDGTHVTFTFYDPIVVAVSATSDVAIMSNPNYGLRGCVPGTDWSPTGICLLAMDVSEAAYGWRQVRGSALVVADAAAAIAVGNPLCPSTNHEGAAMVLAEADTSCANLDEPIVGYARFLPDDTGHVGLLLTGVD